MLKIGDLTYAEFPEAGRFPVGRRPRLQNEIDSLSGAQIDKLCESGSGTCTVFAFAGCHCKSVTQLSSTFELDWASCKGPTASIRTLPSLLSATARVRRHRTKSNPKGNYLGVLLRGGGCVACSAGQIPCTNSCYSTTNRKLYPRYT